MTAPTDAMNPEETLARWRAEEAAVRARMQTAPGVASSMQVAPGAADCRYSKRSSLGRFRPRRWMLLSTPPCFISSPDSRYSKDSHASA